MSKLNVLILRLTSYVSLPVSLLIFIYIVLTNILSLLSIDYLVDPRLYEVPYLKALISVAFAISYVSTIILIFSGTIRYVSVFKLRWSTQLVYLLISLFTSSFFSSKILYPTVITRVQSLLIFLILFLSFPTVIEAYSRIRPEEIESGLSDVNSTEKPPKRLFTGVVLFGISIIVSTASAFVLFSIMKDYFNGTVARERELRRKLYIASIDPRSTAHAQSVTIYGYNLGWNQNNNSKVMSSDGEIPSAIWTNDKIHILIPLHIKEGKRFIWVERRKDESSKKGEVVRSNKVPITVVSRFTHYPTADDPIIIRQFKKLIRLVFLP